MPGRALGSHVGEAPGAAIGDHGDDRDVAQDSQHPRQNQADLADRIEAAHQATIRTVFERAAECGRLLTEAKKQIGHGGFLAWVEANTSIKARQAQRYMQVASWIKAHPNASLPTHLTIEGIVAVIAEPKAKVVRPKATGAAPKPKEAPAKSPSLIASIRDFNAAWSPASIEAAAGLITEEQRADLAHHLPDVIGKLQRLAEPVADAPDLTATDEDEVDVADEAQEEGEGDDPLADLPRPKRTSRPKRWGEACQQAMAALEELRELQAEYQDWRQTLPENMEASATAEKLDAIEGLDIEGAISIVQEIEDADLPLGFGRD